MYTNLETGEQEMNPVLSDEEWTTYCKNVQRCADRCAQSGCGYDGWVVVEQDLFPVKSFDIPLQKAAAGRDNLRKAGF